MLDEWINRLGDFETADFLIDTGEKERQDESRSRLVE